MSEFRILGKSVSIKLTRSGALQAEISAIRSFTFEPRHRILTENYLGETASRQDEVFEEVGGSFSVHPESTQILLLQKMIVDRSTRRISDDEKVSATFSIVFPAGTTARITIPDMKFDPIPINVGGRDAYVEMNFVWKTDKYLLTV